MRLSARSTFYVMAMAASFGMVACGGGDDDAPIVIEGTHNTYVVDSVTIPEDADAADELGFDLDGDDTIDNQLGNILSALKQAAGSGTLDLQGSIDTSVNSGEILLLADIQATSLGQAANAGFRLFLGDNPTPAPCDSDTDLVCRNHLDGSGSFDISADSPTDVAVGGNIIGGRFSGGPGDLALQIAFGDTAINLELIEARADITGITAGAFGNSKVGGAVPNDVIQDEVIPAVFTAISDIMDEDCPAAPHTTDGTCPDGETCDDCGCIDDETGQTLMGIFDEVPDPDGDCQVDLQELRDNSLIKTLLRPDVDTDGDGMADALSVGVGATGIAGTYTVPVAE